MTLWEQITLLDQNDELRGKIAEQAAVIDKLKDVLEKLACLGNGDAHGNSTGNCIAIDALAIPTDSKQILAEYRNVALEEAAKAFEDSAYSNVLFSVYQIANEIRELKETK